MLIFHTVVRRRSNWGAFLLIWSFLVVHLEHFPFLAVCLVSVILPSSIFSVSTAVVHPCFCYLVLAPNVRFFVVTDPCFCVFLLVSHVRLLVTANPFYVFVNLMICVFSFFVALVFDLSTWSITSAFKSLIFVGALMHVCVWLLGWGSG